eukprot:PhF_6_TR27149/c1_g1_i1/m.39654
MAHKKDHATRKLGTAVDNTEFGIGSIGSTAGNVTTSSNSNTFRSPTPYTYKWMRLPPVKGDFALTLSNGVQKKELQPLRQTVGKVISPVPRVETPEALQVERKPSVWSYEMMCRHMMEHLSRATETSATLTEAEISSLQKLKHSIDTVLAGNQLERPMSPLLPLTYISNATQIESATNSKFPTFTFQQRKDISCEETFASFLAMKHMERDFPGATWEFKGVLLFVDISGYTKMTTALGKEGASAVSDAVNGYLSILIQYVCNTFGGDIVKFAGDAILCIWRCEQGDEQLAQLALDAVQCAHVLQSAVGVYTVPKSDVTLRIHIGVDAGTISSHVVQAGVDGSLFHYVSGEVLRRIGDYVDGASSGEICVSTAVAELCGSNIETYVKDKAHPELVMIKDVHAPEPIENSRSPTKGCKLNTQSQKLLPRIVHEQIQAGLPSYAVAELRNLVVMFMTFPTKGLSPSVIKSTLEEVCDMSDRVGAATVQILDDDKGLHVIVAFNLLLAQDDAADASVQLATDLVYSFPTIKVGVSCGETFFGVVGKPDTRCSLDMIGDSVNMACRMMQYGMAHNVSATFTDDLYAASKNRTKLMSLGASTVKGRPVPMEIYSLEPHHMQSDHATITNDVHPIHARQSMTLSKWLRNHGETGNACKILKGRYGSGKWTLTMSSFISNPDYIVFPIVVEEKWSTTPKSIVLPLLALLAQLDEFDPVSSSRVLSTTKGLKMNSLTTDFMIQIMEVKTLHDRAETSREMLGSALVALFRMKVPSVFPFIGLAIRNIHFLDQDSFAILRRLVYEVALDRVMLIGTSEAPRGVVDDLMKTFPSFEIIAVDLLDENEATVLLEVRIQKEWMLTNAKAHVGFSRTINSMTSRLAANVIALTKYIHEHYTLSVKPDRSLTLSRTEGKALAGTTWVKIFPEAVSVYVARFDRLPLVQQLILKVIATLSISLQMVPVSLVFIVMERISEFPRAECYDGLTALIKTKILQKARYEEDIILAKDAQCVNFQLSIMRDTILKLMLPHMSSDINKIAAKKFDSVYHMNTFATFVYRALLRRRSDAVLEGLKDLQCAVALLVNKRITDVSILQPIEDACEIFPESDSVKQILDDVEEKRRAAYASSSSHRTSFSKKVEVPFTIPDLPFLNNSEYDVALQHMCLCFNTVHMAVSGGCAEAVEAESIIELERAVQCYIGQLQTVVAVMKYPNSAEVDQSIEGMMITDHSESTIIWFPALMEAVKKFVADGAMQLQKYVMEQLEVRRRELVEWGPQLMTSWEEQNDQHEHLVAGIRQFQQLIHESDAKGVRLNAEDVGKLLGELANYVVYHFDMEEKAMDEMGYPRKELHKEIHRRFVEKVSAVHKAVLSGDVSAVTADLTGFLVTWLSTHIRVEDAMLADWVTKQQRQADQSTPRLSTSREGGKRQ